ncbi:G protein-coupled glucose receptor regulating Gpa2-domain-containing protein [Phyllosticta citriasiana]|uniref:G protein-coupled glucose receptor regulating Gpa2-domain-containing protein n=1 Tax=Phyllosticta citriasiana TaxID=595635 RepID=UPI0030FDB498
MLAHETLPSLDRATWPSPSNLLLPRASPSYATYPESLDPLPDELRRTLWPIGILAVLSVIACSGLLGWITYRLLVWRRHYQTYVGYNQYVLLIYNLLLADLQQAVSFIISFHWIQQDRMLAPSPACNAQAWLVQIGDVSSGMFVLAIALHTFWGIVKGRQLPYRTFICTTVSVWTVAVLLSILGPILHGSKYFTAAGAWCWVSTDYETERLWLHYIWIFTIEFGTVLIYIIIFIYLRRQLAAVLNAGSGSATHHRINRAARYMLIYPITYVILTLPLAAGRMAAMTGHNLPNTYFAIAGMLMTSCGWIDVFLYTLTRRVLVSNELDPRKTGSGRGPYGSGWEIASFDKQVGNKMGDNIVTITGGRDARSPRGSALRAFGSIEEMGRGAVYGVGGDADGHRASRGKSLRMSQHTQNQNHNQHQHQQQRHSHSRQRSHGSESVDSDREGAMTPQDSTDGIVTNDCLSRHNERGLAALGGVRAETKVSVTVEHVEPQQMHQRLSRSTLRGGSSERVSLDTSTARRERASTSVRRQEKKKGGFDFGLE